MAKLSTEWNVVLAIGLVMIAVSTHARKTNAKGM